MSWCFPFPPFTAQMNMMKGLSKHKMALGEKRKNSGLLGVKLSTFNDRS